MRWRIPRAVVPCDYDSNPERFRRNRAAVPPSADVHPAVAERIADEGMCSVLDIGCGQGALREFLPASVFWLGVDTSAAQLIESSGRVARADACHLPVRSASFDAVAALWMLYHLEEPRDAIREAYRVLRPGGLFVASTARRDDAPELMPASRPSTFDAEEAAQIVGSVFSDIQVDAWDGPMLTLQDKRAVRDYLIGHLENPELARGVRTPITLTKRGCLVWARKRHG